MTTTPVLRAAFLAFAAASAAAKPVDYNRDVRPILAENCFSCHGFDEKARKAKLRLDLAETAHAARENGTPFKPGDAAGREAWQRITSPHADAVMPPPESHLSLTAAQRATIRAWIEQGASYSKHWSFIPPVASPPPVPADGNPAPANPIDAFVRARLAAEGMKPSPEADRRTLIRRLSLDLTGLPPKPADVDAFTADRDPRAIENLVTRLLASPHFGERLALDWLDAARYADTNGFSIDGGRHHWLWRDWVIQAFNDNLPYDRFLLEQLAGDLLPNRTDGQLIASGFQRNNMTTHEGGTIPEENLLNYNADRVKTFGETVLGLTLACAQCHDHKYDPISARDYYQVFAYFNTLGDRGLDGNAGVNAGPAVMARTVLRTDEPAGLAARIAELQTHLATLEKGVLSRWITGERALLATRGRDLAVHPVEVLKASTPNRALIDIEQARRVRVREGGELAAIDISTRLPALAAPITGVRVVVHPVPELPGGGWGRGPVNRAAAAAATKAKRAATKVKTAPATKAAPAPVADGMPAKGTFRLTALSVSADAVAGDQIDLNRLRHLERVTASSWEPENPPAGCLDPRNDSGWSPDLAAEGPVHLTATFAEPLRAGATPFLNVQLNFGAGRQLMPELVEVFVITGIDDGTDLPAAAVAALGASDARRDQATTELLWKICAQRSPDLRRERVELANLQDRLATLTEPQSTMVMAIAEKPRDTFILNRGDYAQPTEKVGPGTPAALPPPPAGATADRLGLAQWVVMRENPLTARVAVNRFWKLLFGTGLVATPMDFGAQGEWPSHPELLDWLAADFVAHGWDVKRLVALITTSATYRQSSAADAGALERDPANRLLARGPRFRLAAELIRDQALAVSGLLVPRIGGPSVNPYSPFDLWREVSHYGSTPATAQVFVQDHGEKLHRRSMYTYWKRTAPPASMVAFDAPNREVCTVARGNTNTPLQALVLLNDVQFIEAARVLAERLLAAAPDDDARVRHAFLATLSRPPAAAEAAVISRALARERARYTRDEAAARALLAAGESPRDERIPVPEHAAWTQVASLVLNLSETVMRN
ncbi:MAG: PSD1 and planctomycete cytochrome C domain-containing protein [Opitutaceae bacterium]